MRCVRVLSSGGGCVSKKEEEAGASNLFHDCVVEARIELVARFHTAADAEDATNIFLGRSRSVNFRVLERLFDLTKRPDTACTSYSHSAAYFSCNAPFMTGNAAHI